MDLRVLNKPPSEAQFREERGYWLRQRESLALNEIEERLRRHFDNPEETLTFIAHMESKEREIEEKTRKARRSVLGILFIGLYPIFSFPTSCYYKVKGLSMRCFAALATL